MTNLSNTMTPICELPYSFDPRLIGEEDLLQSTAVERVHGTYKARPVAWMRRLMNLSRSVARVKDEFGNTVGSGFLAHLNCPHYKGVALLTSTHVYEPIADTARISFDEQQPNIDYLTEQVWSSPANELDVTISALRPHSDESVNCDDHSSVALTLDEQDLPEKIKTPTGHLRSPRVFPIGYPGGGALSISIEDNKFVGIRSHPETPLARMAHYKAPTHSGSSGGPVISEDQKVIAIHRAGGDTTQSLGGRIFSTLSGGRKVNEGASAAALLEILNGCHPGH